MFNPFYHYYYQLNINYYVRGFQHPGGRVSMASGRNLLIVAGVTAFLTDDILSLAWVLSGILLVALLFFVASMYYGARLMPIETDSERAQWYPEKKRIARFTSGAYYSPGTWSSGLSGSDAMSGMPAHQGPTVNINGLPMIEGGGVDIMGNPYGSDRF